MKLKRLTILLLFTFLVMVVTNPKERDYLGRIANDYGMVHAGAQLNVSDLLQMGEGVSADYLIFSRYQYSFGDVSVNYFGIFNGIYYTGRGRKLKKYRESLAYSAW